MEREISVRKDVIVRKVRTTEVSTPVTPEVIPLPVVPVTPGRIKPRMPINEPELIPPRGDLRVHSTTTTSPPESSGIEAEEIEKSVSYKIALDGENHIYLYICIGLAVVIVLLSCVIFCKICIRCCKKEVRYVDHYSESGNKLINKI